MFVIRGTAEQSFQAAYLSSSATLPKDKDVPFRGNNNTRNLNYMPNQPVSALRIGVLQKVQKYYSLDGMCIKLVMLTKVSITN